MRSALLGTVFACVASAAFAQSPATPPPAADAVLAAAPESLRDQFTAEPDGLRHRTSGLRCPREHFQLGLTGLRAGVPGDDREADAPTCVYQDGPAPVLYLSFRSGAPALSDAYCRSVPDRLKLNKGPALPGVRRHERPGEFPHMRVTGPDGAARPITSCGLYRAPFEPGIGIVVAAVSAATLGDWTLQALHTPAPPPCCGAYPGVVPLSFFLATQTLLQEAARPAS